MRKRAIAAVAVAGSVLFSGCAAINQEWHSNCVVQAKDILVDVSGSNGDTKTTRTKRVSTSCGSFNAEDALSVGQFDSWDIWQKLEVGKKYDIKTGGQRIGFFSVFPTILEVKPVG